MVRSMIKLTKLNKEIIYVNPHQIETMESTPDTVLRMLSDRRILVKENCNEVTEKIVAYRKQIGWMGNDSTV